jgi:hypothetical protein
MTPTIGERLVTHRAAKRPRIGRRDRPVASRSQIADGFSFCYRVPVGGDQTLLAPAFTSTEAELEEMVERMAAVVLAVERRVKDQIAAGAAAG